MACYGLSAGAQVRPNSNFIYLFSDSLIYANSIKLRPDFANVLQLRVDSRRVPTAQVKFFNNEDGFFANTRKFNFFGANEFSERIITGRINFYRQFTYDPYGYNRSYRFRNRQNESVDVRMFYNKGYGDLKKVNYANLKQDMADSAESMDLLEGYKKKLNTSRILYGTAGASILAGLISFVVNAKQNQNMPPFIGAGPSTRLNNGHKNFAASFGLLGLGAGLAVGGYLVDVQAERHLENAVDAYNK